MAHLYLLDITEPTYQIVMSYMGPPNDLEVDATLLDLFTMLIDDAMLVASLANHFLRVMTSHTLIMLTCLVSVGVFRVNEVFNYHNTNNPSTN